LKFSEWKEGEKTIQGFENQKKQVFLSLVMKELFSSSLHLFLFLSTTTIEVLMQNERMMKTKKRKKRKKKRKKTG